MKAIVLAAGKGTRMNSDLPKVLHEVKGKALAQYVVDAVRRIGILDVFLVVGYQEDRVREAFSGQDIRFVSQAEQLGTGHAVQQVVPLISGSDEDIVVLAGDCPLISGKTLSWLFETHRESGAAASVLSAVLEDAGGYGRILKDDSGGLLGIREAKDCSPDELLIGEFNSGVYCFKIPDLIDSLGKLNTDNQQGEFYLTDTLHLLREDGKRVQAVVCEDSDEVIGVNRPEELAMVAEVLDRRDGVVG